MENILLLPFALFALWIALGMVLELIGVVVGIALAVAECVIEARRRKALGPAVTADRGATVWESTAGAGQERRRVIEIEGRRLRSGRDGEGVMETARDKLVAEVRRSLGMLVDGHRSGDAIVGLEPRPDVAVDVSFDGTRRWQIVLDASEEAWAWATDSKLELVDHRDGDRSPLDLYGTPGWWIELSGTARRGMYRTADAVADYLARRGVEGVKGWSLGSRRGRLETVEHLVSDERRDRILQAALDALDLQITLWGMLGTCCEPALEEICLENSDDEQAIARTVEYLRADGAEEERWFGPCHNQFYWDASRRCAVTQGNCIGRDDDVEVFCADPDGTPLYVDVGAVEDAGLTWHGLWVRTYAWDRRLEHQRLTLTVDGEPTTLELRYPGWYIDWSERYRRPAFEERSIFNAPPGLLRKIARARAVSVRLEGSHEVIEREFARQNIDRVRKFVRDNMVGEELRQTE